MPSNTVAFPYESTPGTTNVPGGPAGEDKMWLPMFQGEILKAYDDYNFMESLINHQTITSGHSLEYPITGTVDLEAAWGAGQELSGGGTTSDTIAINLDARPMAAYFEVDNIAKLVSQWDFMSVLAHQVGQTLANARDRQLLVYVLRASAEAFDELADTGTDPRGLLTADLPVFSAAANGEFGEVHAASGADERTLGALLFLQAVEDWIVYLQENDLPTDRLYAAVTPKQFQDLRALGVPRVAADVGVDVPLFGGIAEQGGLGVPLPIGLNKLSDTLTYMGVTIVKTNHMATSATAAGANGEARYTALGDFSGDADFASTGDTGVCSLMWHPDAIGGLTLQGMKINSSEDVRRNTQFTVASMMHGTGVLRPELAACFGTLSDSATPAAFTRDSGAAVGSLFELIGLTGEFATTS